MNALVAYIVNETGQILARGFVAVHGSLDDNVRSMGNGLAKIFHAAHQGHEFSWIVDKGKDVLQHLYGQDLNRRLVLFFQRARLDAALFLGRHESFQG